MDARICETVKPFTIDNGLGFWDSASCDSAVLGPL